jgi:GT2 family glycosyltransferase
MVESEHGNKVTIVKTGANLGFSAANNVGVDVSSGDVLFFLNPDTQILSKEIWVGFKQIGDDHIYTTRLTGADGVEYSNLSAIPTVGNYINRLLGRRYLVWAQGSVVIMSRKVCDLLGKWPEDYFMYSEDLDLFYHAALRNIHVSVLDASVMHIGGGTTAAVWSPSDRQKRVELSYLRFSRKYKLVADYHLLHLAGLLKTLFRHPAKAWFVYSVYLKTWGSDAR